MKQKVLFVCTGNSARSQMAEGLLRAKVGTRMEVFSAGTLPKGLNPLATKVMMEAGVDISSHRSKDISQFEGQIFDFVITVCDRAKQSCPVFPGTKSLHWEIADPETLEEFRSARDELSSRVDEFLRNNMSD